jgi:hypothetical protein
MPKKSIQMTFSSTFLKHTPNNNIDNHMGAGGTTLAEREGAIFRKAFSGSIWGVSRRNLVVKLRRTLAGFQPLLLV